MTTNWSGGLDPTTVPSDVVYGDGTFSTPRVFVAVVAISCALGSLGLALVGSLGWNRFGDHLAPLVYLALLCAGVALVATRWDAARREPTAYLVLALVATAVYLEVAYGDLDDWDRLLPGRDDVSTWLRSYHRSLSTILALLAVSLVVVSRRATGRGSRQPPREHDDAGPPR